MSAINKINVDNVSYNIEDSRVDNIADSIPTASTEQKGLVQVGQGINVDENGVISVEASGSGDSVSYTDGGTPATAVIGTLNINGTDYEIKAPWMQYQDNIGDRDSHTVLGIIDNGLGSQFDINAPVVSYTDMTQGEVQLGFLNVGGDSYNITCSAASGDSVQFNSLLASGTQIGTITINGVDTAIYAPAGGSGGGSSVSYRDNTSPEDQHRTVIGELTIDGGGYYIYVPSTISVDWNNVLNKPTIPTATSELTNDSDFITAGDARDIAADEISNTSIYDLQGAPSVIGDIDGLTVTPDLSTGTKIATISWTDGSGANTQDIYAPASGGSSEEPHFEVEIEDDGETGQTQATVYYNGDPMESQVGGEFWNDPNFIKACNNPVIITRTDYTFKTIGIATFDTSEGYYLWITLANPTYGMIGEDSIAIGRLVALLAWDDVNNELVFESVNLMRGYDSTEVESLLQTGTPIANIKINNDTTTIYAPQGGSGGGDTVTVTQTVTSATPGTKIAEIDVSGTTTDIYAPKVEWNKNSSLNVEDYNLGTLSVGNSAQGIWAIVPDWDATDPQASGSRYSGHIKNKPPIAAKNTTGLTINNSNNTAAAFAIAGGNGTQATGQGAVAMGFATVASGQYANAEGMETKAYGEASHAEGRGSRTGVNGESSGSNAHAEGSNTVATGFAAHAEGDNTQATADYAHAEGFYSLASDTYSHAEGIYTLAQSNSQHAQGRYNKQDIYETFADIIGNGTSVSNRSNAEATDWSGNKYLAGNVYVNCSDFTTTANGLQTTNCGGAKLLTSADVAVTPVLSTGTHIANITVNGTTSGIYAPTQVNANWNETDQSSAAYIQNKPRIITSATTSNILINTTGIPFTRASSNNVCINASNFSGGETSDNNVIIGPNHRFSYTQGGQNYLIGNGLKVYGSWNMALGFYNIPETGKKCYSFILGDGFNDTHQHTALAIDASTHNAYFSDGIYVGCTDYTTTVNGLTTLGAGGFRIDMAPEEFNPDSEESRTDDMIMVDSINYTKIDEETDPDTGDVITPASYTAEHNREWRSFADLLTSLDTAPEMGAGIYTLQIWGITRYDTDGNSYIESEFRWVKTSETTPADDAEPTPEEPEPDPEEEPTEEEPTE